MVTATSDHPRNLGDGEMVPVHNEHCRMRETLIRMFRTSTRYLENRALKAYLPPRNGVGGTI